MSDAVKITPKRMMNRIVVAVELFDDEVMFVSRYPLKLLFKLASWADRSLISVNRREAEARRSRFAVLSHIKPVKRALEDIHKRAQCLKKICRE